MGLIFIKLGGSLITDKRIEASFRQNIAQRLAEEIQTVLITDPEMKILIGHGSGSFGHFAAKKYRTIEGVHSDEEWRGFAQVANIASELNYLLAKTLQNAGVPVWRVQPSASAISRSGKIISMSIQAIQQAIEHGLVPLVYGDVCLDEVLGGTIISTETIFFYLAQHLPVETILLVGEVDGVYDQIGRVIVHISPGNLSDIEAALGGSDGVDVTGGMATKVRDMIALSQQRPGLSIRIINGLQPELLQRTLLNQAQPGTLIHADASI